MPKLADPELLRADAYVDGAWTAAGGGQRFAVTNPATGEQLAEVADLDAADARAAIEAAARGLPGLGAPTPPRQRAAILRKWFELIMAAQEDLAQLMTAEQGKPLAETRGEVAYGASFIEWFAEEAKRVYGDVIPTHAAGKRILVLKQPIGVVGGDHALELPDRHDHPQGRPGARGGLHGGGQAAGRDAALGAGAGRAGRARRPAEGGAQRRHHHAGPGGRPGADPATRWCGSSPSPARPRSGTQLMAQCASTVKKVSLELGGNAPFIVFDDADLDAAVEGALASKYRNMGQTCVCANRFLVQDGVYDAFETKLAERVRGDEGRQRRRGRRRAGSADQHGRGREGRAAARRGGGGRREGGGGRPSPRARAAPSSSPPWSPASRPRWRSRARRSSGRWRR